MRSRRFRGISKVLVLLALTSLLVGAVSSLAFAQGPVGTSTGAEDVPQKQDPFSHRLIVELEAAPLAVVAETAASRGAMLTPDGKLDVSAPEAQTYIAQLKADQRAFVNAMQAAVPGAAVSTYVNEFGQAEQATYQVVFNGIAVDLGVNPSAETLAALKNMDGVKAVYRDFEYKTQLYTSTTLINAPVAWNMLGGREDAGAGVKFASVDTGVPANAPMFSGEGFTMPEGYPKGLLSNTNNKVIVSRAYFRPWDPPLPGDEGPAPGVAGSSHGPHTASTAAGNVVEASYAGLDLGTISGVAPGAYVMSYKTFYPTNSAFSGSAFSIELIASVEDAVMDGADVINNSWGGGPGSIGGMFDALDMALVNAVRAGTFVAMSNGNAGPGLGTMDHPSADYINVAASTTSGTLAAGELSVSAPTPVSATLQSLPFGTADFGDPIPIGQVFTYDYLPSVVADSANFEGCSPFPENAFDGKAALVSRGGCFFSTKVYYAQEAGADFVIIYNNSGGDEIINMGAGDFADQITVSSIFVSQNSGAGLVDWYGIYTDSAEITLNTIAFQAGNTPDQIANFSSRGPAANDTLKPDIAAPGVNILAQGYTPGASGVDRHQGYGQVSGTSMAAPHVAGAATLLKQMYPDWSNADIKSALMSTSKYKEIFNQDGSPAQPLDMGAGRLDVAAAMYPGVILDPPSLSFGSMATGTVKSMMVQVTSVATTTQVYSLYTEYTGGGFGTLYPPVAGLSVSPTVVSLAPGAMAMVEVTFDTAMGMGIGDNQGFLVMQSEGYHAHMPFWSRVIPAQKRADVLVIDNDFSDLLGLPNYLDAYTSVLDQLGYTYEVWNADLNFANPTTVPDAATLSAYRGILYFTGDNFYSDGSFTVSTPLTELDTNRLVEFANQGGFILAMGQDLSTVLGADTTAPFLYGGVFGAEYLQDDVTGNNAPLFPVIATDSVPAALEGAAISLNAGADFMDEIRVDEGAVLDGAVGIAPLFKYSSGAAARANATVAIAHRDQPSLERPGISYLGSSIYTTFGLEHVNNNVPGALSQPQLLGALMQWGLATADVSLTANTPMTNTSLLAEFTATSNSSTIGTTYTGTVSLGTSTLPVAGVSYRWDFGDGSPYVTSSSNSVIHQYETCGVYNVRVEMTDALGNVALAETEYAPLDVCGTTDNTQDNTITFSTSSGATVNVFVPANTLLPGQRLVQTARTMPRQNLLPDFEFAGVSFDLDVFSDTTRLDAYTFTNGITITIDYGEAPVSPREEGSLVLHLYDEEAGTWVDAATTCPSSYVRDMDNDTLAVRICHLTEFALVNRTAASQASTLYLPLVVKDSPGSIAVEATKAGFTALVGALQATGLDTVLGDVNSGPYTVFAPTNAAFNAISTTVASLTLTQTQNVLLYHVVQGEVPAATVVANSPLAAQSLFAGHVFTVTATTGTNAMVTVEDEQGNVANVTITDIPAANGVIHVIDKVILPNSLD